MDTIPKMNDEKANQALNSILSFKNKIFSELIEKYPVLKDLEYEKCSSFHTYSANGNNEHGFTAHIDFGMIAVVFTLGRDFEYSEDHGITWLKLSDHTDVTKNSVIVNFGRFYSIITGQDPVLHRVTASGNLTNYGFPEIAKFTLGFFIDIKSNLPIPNVIPENIQGIHRKNWLFLLKNCNYIGDYNRRRIDGTIYEVDGVLTQN